MRDGAGAPVRAAETTAGVSQASCADTARCRSALAGQPLRCARRLGRQREAANLSCGVVVLIALASTWRQGGRGMQGTLSFAKRGAPKPMERANVPGTFRPTRPSASAPPKPPAVSLSLSAAQPDSRQLGRARDAVHVGFVLQAARANHHPARATSKTQA